MKTTFLKLLKLKKTSFLIQRSTTQKHKDPKADFLKHLGDDRKWVYWKNKANAH